MPSGSLLEFVENVWKESYRESRLLGTCAADSPPDSGYQPFL